MDCVNILKTKSKCNNFRDIDYILDNIDSFDKYSLKKNKLFNNLIINQLFSKEPPPFELVQKILFLLINKELNDDTYYEFSRKTIFNKNIIENTNIYIEELKKYYLKCKHSKYLENLNEKKIITIYRQILRPYNFTINAYEKYNNGEKFLLYVIKKRKELSLKKVNSVINFD
jgi:hypothetical protein